MSSTQTKLRKALYYLPIGIIAFWMLFGAYGHFANPEFFYPFVPDFMPKKFVVYASGFVELLIGIAVLLPKYRHYAGLAFAALCLAFLPLHVWDLFRDNPAIAPLSAAIIRIIVQFILIAIGYKVWTRGPKV